MSSSSSSSCRLSVSTCSLQSLVSDSETFYDTPDLTAPDDFSDVVLLVDNRRLYTCRGILASASPVFRHMFTSDFREKKANEVQLPDKHYDHVHELLLCISPAIQKTISGANVHDILPLADEYQMIKLKCDCELWLLNHLESVALGEQSDYIETLLRCLQLAQHYSLQRLGERAVQLVASMDVAKLEAHQEYRALKPDTIIQILKQRVQTLEQSSQKTERAVDHLRTKSEELEDVVKRMSREKLTVKRVLDELDTAWDIKGPDTRCIDPVHIYGPRNYKCDKCTKQTHIYFKSKVCFLLNKGSHWSGINWPQ